MFKALVQSAQTSGDELDMRYITALNLQAELKRIKVLRNTPALKGLVRELADGIETWKTEHKDDIQEVHTLRVNSHVWDKEDGTTPTPTPTIRDAGAPITRPTYAQDHQVYIDQQCSVELHQPLRTPGRS